MVINMREKSRILSTVLVVILLGALIFTAQEEEGNVAESAIGQGQEATDSAEGYTDVELCQMATGYFFAHSEGKKTIDYVRVDSELENGMVLLQLYDVVDDHGVTWDWYTVDRKTAKGYNANFEEIDLTDY